MTTPAGLRLGMIGAGWISATHLESLAALGGATVAAVADPDADRAGAVASASGAAPYADWRAMLDGEQLDGVLVLTPPALHREHCIAALEQGLPVYLEKPVARSREDARAIQAAVREHDGLVAVGYQYRALEFLPQLAEAAREDLGMLLSRSMGATAGRPWFTRQAEGGGQVLERASHHLDLQRAVGGDVDWVQAAGAKVPLAGDERPADSDIDDVLMLTLGFRSGALGSVAVAWSRRGLPSAYTLDLVAANATLHVELDPGFSAVGVRDGERVDLRTPPPIRRGLGMFLDAVRAGDPGRVACDVEAAAGTLDVALACEQSLAAGGRVDVER